MWDDVKFLISYYWYCIFNQRKKCVNSMLQKDNDTAYWSTINWAFTVTFHICVYGCKCESLFDAPLSLK